MRNSRAKFETVYSRSSIVLVSLATATASLLFCANAATAQPPDASFAPELMLDKYCVRCHNPDDRAGQLALDEVDPRDPLANIEIWEKVIRKLRHRQMPPDGKKRPDESTYDAMVTNLESSIDRLMADRPDPGRTDSLRRLNRTEYQNAIRDLLALDIDAESLLPHDESGHGFDNVTLRDLSPTLLDRYISAAQRISKLAVGSDRSSPRSDVFRVKPDLTQEEHVPGLPIGTRGGVAVPYTFAQDGDYDIQIWLARDRNEEIEGLKEPQQVELLLDRERIQTFSVEPPANSTDHSFVDKHLKIRIHITAGPHQLVVTFPKNRASLLETTRQPFQAHFNLHRHPRITPAVFQVSITGPYASQGPGDTPSRRRIFVCQPSKTSEEEDCAERILSTLMRRAYRRPISEADLEGPMAFYREGRSDGDFDAGIERALSALLVSAEFLFRVERDPEGLSPGDTYRISDIELASRLSFFLWSSIPDDELLDAAMHGELSRPQGLEKQARRLLADPRAYNLASNFAGQWLLLRRLDSYRPDARLFPDFDDNLRQAFREETELFVESILREDRSVLDLLNADYTFLNERLAKHYGIPHVYGSRFRRVSLDAKSNRGGLLRHGSILTVTSFATRTSPVLRGKWVLDNIFGAPPSPPPPDVSALQNNLVSATLPMRRRLSEHRNNEACASCHNTIDPVGFALENFDAVGRWRDFDDGLPVDVTGGLPDGSVFEGVAGLEQGLLNRPELFVQTLTEKLLTFALGRGVEFYDAPAIRKILREAEPNGYRFSSILLGIVKSAPFQMRKSA